MDNDLNCCICFWAVEAKKLTYRIFAWDIFTSILSYVVLALIWFDPLDQIPLYDRIVLGRLVITIAIGIASPAFVTLIILSIRQIRENGYDWSVKSYYWLRTFLTVVYFLLCVAYVAFSGLIDTVLKQTVKEQIGAVNTDINKYKANVLYHFILGGVGILFSFINIILHMALKKTLFFFEQGIYNEIEQNIANRLDNPKLEASNQVHVPVTQMHILRDQNA